MAQLKNKLEVIIFMKYLHVFWL